MRYLDESTCDTQVLNLDNQKFEGMRQSHAMNQKSTVPGVHWTKLR